MESTTIPRRSPASLGWFLVVIAAAGPLAIAVLRAILPYGITDSTADIVSKVAAHPGAESAVLWFTYLAMLTLPIGVFVTARVAMRARPVFGTIAAVVAWLGFASMFASVVASDYAVQAATTSGIPGSSTATLLDAMAAHPATSVALAVFLVGHILGGILLGIAVWRVIPVWAAIALAISQPLHFLFAAVVPIPLLDGLAWVLLAIGFAAVARASMKVGPYALAQPVAEPSLR
jgi:hypothetical protein